MRSRRELVPLQPQGRKHSPEPDTVKSIAVALLLATAAGIAGLLAFLKKAGGPADRGGLRALPTSSDAVSERRAGVARQLNGAAAVLAFAVMSDSGLEHYRGLFFNPAMYTPLVVSTMTLGVSLHGAKDRRKSLHRFRDVVYGLAALTGLVGTGFHIYNIGKRPGRVSFQNLFYAAPIGAPFALLLAGVLGVAAERVRDAPRNNRPQQGGLPEGRALAAISAAGLLGTATEAALFHFRGAYHNPFMFLPVTLPPLGALLLMRAAIAGNGSPRPVTRAVLRVTVALGFGGVGFHAYGISRNMGGWRNWSQNVFNGPPLPAPPSFTGLALAGLASLRLLENAP